jgi:hypothetical protein
MKTSVRSILLTGAVVLGANMMIAGPRTDGYLENVHKAKLGRCPAAEERLKAERANMPFVAETAQAVENDSWVDKWHKAKHNMTSAADEARMKAEQESTAFREDTAAVAGPAVNPFLEQWYKAKMGRGVPGK